MGVLMSKKQQVQKCSVVSAFKEGLRDRPAPSPADHADGSGGEGDGPGSASAPARGPAADQEKQEVEQRETDGKAGASTSTPASCHARDECKVNQEAWSRLRDGKGVEPEDLDKSRHQLTPPAFVRPKRDANDGQPMEVDLGQMEQPVNEEVCEVCEVWTADVLFPCRTCTRVFHDGCLREMGVLKAEALQEMRETAHTATGWSCYYCGFPHYDFNDVRNQLNK
ncbi:LOW QUALITY PROTEIN: PHD finger protein 24 [Osmerus eperlanus]|uniref:LOW QUALITY PROTEIN: PHD finger protein 24 n=1 Tax=Osmerus eperlanus TaxID=29151 RepID=UPI002E0DA09B